MVCTPPPPPPPPQKKFFWGGGATFLNLEISGDLIFAQLCVGGPLEWHSDEFVILI